MTGENKFYYQGKYFDNETEFWDYVKEWGNLELDRETCERQLDRFKLDIISNIFMYHRKITNREFNKYIEFAFWGILFNLNKKEE